MKTGLHIILLLICLSFGASAWALETDNYIVWGHELKDSKTFINDFLAREIRSSLERSNGKNKSCAEVTAGIAKTFKSIGVKNNPVENFLVKNLPTDSVYPQTFDYVGESIYREPFMPHLPSFGLSPNVQANGIYFGTDKLSHFASTGYIYFLIYSVSRKAGKSEEESMINAITYGVKDEQSLHGYFASGVFSYADLEANYQGLLFYRRMCEGKDAYLEQETQGNWILKNAPDISEFINPLWDESYNHSYFVKLNWNKVSPYIREYCPSRNDRYEASFKKSFSHQYIDSLKMRGNAPLPQKICGNIP